MAACFSDFSRARCLKYTEAAIAMAKINAPRRNHFQRLRVIRRDAVSRAFGALVAMGLGLSMSLQAFVNMGVAVGLLPVTGLTIPLVSMGGTSLFMNSIGFGIILGISKYVQEEKQQQEEALTAGI